MQLGDEILRLRLVWSSIRSHSEFHFERVKAITPNDWCWISFRPAVVRKATEPTLGLVTLKLDHHQAAGSIQTRKAFASSMNPR